MPHANQPSVAGTSRCVPADAPLETFWQTQRDELHDLRSTEALPEHSDIVIIGAGYAGVSTAYHLVKDFPDVDRSITILEARGVCSGATGRNGGHARPDLYGHVPKYIERAGARAGAEVAEFEVANLFALKQIIREEKIDCDFTLARSLDVWCNEEGAKQAKAIYDQMVEHNFEYMEDVIFYTGDQVEGICGVKGAKACASFTAGTMWPYKFILHLTRLIHAAGVNVQANTPVTSVEPDSTGLFCHHTQGKDPCRQSCLREQCADGSIIVGGAAAVFRNHEEQWYDNVDDGVLIDSAKDYYHGYMQRTYRGWEDTGAKVDKIWSGVMGYSYDLHPHIGCVPEAQDQYIIAGFNGHGMPVIWLSSKELAKMITMNIPFEKTSMPRLFQTTQARLDRALNGTVEDGDVLGGGSPSATKP
ncbi:hypothetical protein N7470_003212 [Penicillium chermesinum]|nr:hypothetical protein N7470_003212 [Penicillium chermesinum]